MPRRSLPERRDLVQRDIKPEQDLTGCKDFGEWEVLEYAGTKNGHWFRCRCSCGYVAVVHGGQLRSGVSLSCGHNGSTFKHGCANRGEKTEEYNIWLMMRDRCNNPNNKQYKDYGGRGIKVCERWDNFENFLVDMGPRPSPQHSIDRFPDNNGNYELGNCRWATRAQQRRNSRRIINVTHNGRTMCLKDWCTELGLSYGWTSSRIRRGENAERVLFGKEV